MTVMNAQYDSLFDDIYLKWQFVVDLVRWYLLVKNARLRTLILVNFTFAVGNLRNKVESGKFYGLFN